MLEAEHGATTRRTWRKLHLAADSNSMIVAQTLTDQDADDPSQVRPAARFTREGWSPWR